MLGDSSVNTMHIPSFLPTPEKRSPVEKENRDVFTRSSGRRQGKRSSPRRPLEKTLGASSPRDLYWPLACQQFS